MQFSRKVRKAISQRAQGSSSISLNYGKAMSWDLNTKPKPLGAKQAKQNLSEKYRLNSEEIYWSEGKKTALIG